VSEIPGIAVQTLHKCQALSVATPKGTALQVTAENTK